jgi:5S rRNA maturation endonuclease (ribonuclease M5)
VAARRLSSAVQNFTCSAATFLQSVRLSLAATTISPERLGVVGPSALSDYAYARASEIVKFGAVEPFAEIPVVVEAWAQKPDDTSKTSLVACVNRTPVTADISAARDKLDIDAFGCGLSHTIATAPIAARFQIVINVISPYVPITSDGKEPDLLPFLDSVGSAVQKAVRKAHRPASAGERPRGSIYDAHRRETIPLGTLMIEEYERPIWLYNKLIHIEKEGFSEALKEVSWAERHDCALSSTKGFTTRAIRDLVDKLAEHDEPVTVFLVTDADAYGTMIYQTFQEATKARGARKVKIEHLGLHPWDAIADGLEVEDIPAGEKRKAVAGYVLQRDQEYPNEAPGGTSWEEWLQTHRIELNAMTTPQFIAWLDRKMAEYQERRQERYNAGKLLPPADVIAQELEDQLEAHVRSITIERILREADLEGQVDEALSKIERPRSAMLANGIREMFKTEPEQEWRAYIERVVAKICDDPGDPI